MNTHVGYVRLNHLSAWAGSAGWPDWEQPFLAWAERNGYGIDVVTNADLEEHPTIVDRYELLLSVGHDEYWSAAQRDAVESFVAGGGNYASFSGNTIFWQVRLVDDGASMVCHKYRAHLDDPIAARHPTAMTGMWCDPVVQRPESRFLGASSMYGLYSRFGQATPRGVGGFVVYRDDHWMLAGTGLAYGDVVGSDDGVVGYETVGTRFTFDEVNLPIAIADPLLPAASDVDIVAVTPSSNLAMGEYPKSIAALDDQGDLEFIAERAFGGGPQAVAKARHGNAVMLVCRPFGADAGQVVTVGTTDWVFGLGDPQVGRVTRNVFDHLSRRDG